jgi:carbon-monoxide dehydrogenase large subunit
MEASQGDIECAKGRFTIAGTDRSIGIMELAQRLRDRKLPEGVPSSLDVDHATKDTPSTFPNGCHVAEVEIDPETGVTQIVRYTGDSDFGTIVNPMIVDGQLHGGVAQNRQALMEEVSYDEERPADHWLVHGLCDAARRRHSADANRRSPLAPAKSNPLGTKGCG